MASAGATILSLPLPVLERILTIAADGRRGRLPFAAWPVLTSVHPAFRAAFYAGVTRVALSDAYAAPGGYESLPAYAAAAARLLAGPLLSCRRLRSLDLNGCDALRDDDVALFASRCPPLASLALTVCREQTDASVVALARVSPRLRRVDIGGCDRHRHSMALLAATGEGEEDLREARWASTRRHRPCAALTNSSLVALSTFCRTLRSVCLSNAPHLTDTALLAVASLPELAAVVLRRLPSITDAGVRALVSGPARITSLSLFSITSLGDQSLEAVAAGRATRDSLEFFGMTFSYNVTDAGFAKLVSVVPTLDELQVDHCARVSDTWTAKVGAGGGLSRVSLRNVGIVVTARGLHDLASSDAGVTSLMALNLGFVSSVDAELLRALRKAAPLLEVLVLDACGSIDSDGAGVIGEFENLRVLDVSWCSKLDPTGISAICNGVAGPRLTRLSIGPIPSPFEEIANMAVDDPGAVENVAAAPIVEGGNVVAANAAAAFNGIPPAGEQAGEAEEVAAAPVLEAFMGPEAAEIANALDLVLDEDAEPGMLAAAFGQGVVAYEDEGVSVAADEVFYEIERKCTSLQELVLSGSVNPRTLAWLQNSTGIRVDYLDMHNGIGSNMYTAGGDDSEDL
jgi:hypothetical protein